jgi:hypothetical protein
VNTGTENGFLSAASLAGSVAFVALFTALSGLGDALGFVYAGKTWQDGRFVWNEAIKCVAAFQLGMIMYWLALWRLTSLGVVAAETQTLCWFAATIVGVALFSGRIFRWQVVD